MSPQKRILLNIKGKIGSMAREFQFDPHSGDVDTIVLEFIPNPQPPL